MRYISDVVFFVVMLFILTVNFAFFFKKKVPVILVINTVFILAAILLEIVVSILGYAEFTIAFYAVMFLIILCTIIDACVYQNEIKQSFAFLSKLKKKQTNIQVSDEEIREGTQAIVTACQQMSKSRTGALIIIVRDKIDQYIVDSGTKLDAIISTPLLVSIFNTRCPMHDGAVIIKNNRIVAAGSFLPLSETTAISKDIGTRHRAGIGVTEKEGNDVISIIVSEENGIISVAEKGTLRRYFTPERLFDLLYDPYKVTKIDKKLRK